MYALLYPVSTEVWGADGWVTENGIANREDRLLQLDIRHGSLWMGVQISMVHGYIYTHTRIYTGCGGLWVVSQSVHGFYLFIVLQHQSYGEF